MTDEMGDPANWPLLALLAWMSIWLSPIGRSKVEDPKRIIAGVCFSWLALKMAEGFNFPLHDRWFAMVFGYVGTVAAIVAIRAK
jgi:hypothetical protein